MKKTKKMKKTLLLDFDGVLYSYSSGWKGPRIIPDPPVPGALEFLVEAIDTFDVQIYSSRSRHWGGKKAMRRWLEAQYKLIAPSWNETPDFFRDWVCETAFADPWGDSVDYAISRLIHQIKFPTMKPAAFLTVDDRCICFDGDFSTLGKKISQFIPWHKKGAQ